jgi:hypothetical protein
MDLMYPSITRESSAASVGVNSPFATAVVIAAIALVAPSTELTAGSKQQSWRSWLVGTLTEDMAALRYPRIGALKLIETIRHAFALRLGTGEVFLRVKVGTLSALSSGVPRDSAQSRRRASAGFATTHGTSMGSFGRRKRKRG